MSKTDFYNSLCLSEINIAHKYVAKKKNYPMKNSGRAHYGMMFTVMGTETYNFKSGRIDAVPDSLLFVPKGEEYTIDFSEETSIVYTIDFELRDPLEIKPFCVKLGKNNVLKFLFIDAAEKWRNSKPESAMECRAIFYNILAGLIKRELYYSNNRNRMMIADAVSYLHTHYLEEDFKISTLSEIAKMSPRYFGSLFLKEFGTTPRNYVISLKINKAKELLQNEKTSVTDVAHQLGYAEIYHFSKFFKAKTGYSPSEYKNSVIYGS